MTLDQKRARAFGVLYLITFVTSIPALLIIANIATAVVIYPIVRRRLRFFAPTRPTRASRRCPP